MALGSLAAFTVLPLFALVGSALYASVAAYRMCDWRPTLFVVVVALMAVHQTNELLVFLDTGAASASMGFGEYPETGVNLLTSAGAVAVLRSIERQRTLSAELGRKLERERELQQENERLDEFISIISHDLRNPLNIAQSRTTLLSRETDSEHVQPLEEALDRMQTIVEHTLTLAREGEPVTDPDPIDVEFLAQQCWSMVEAGDARLEIADECTIYGDADRLRHVFENLFRNSVEHGGEDVTLRVGCEEGVLFVEDDGPGIPESEQSTVLEAGKSLTDGGTGFGLAIVNRMAEAHGWDLRVNESDTGGARFEFEGALTDPTDGAEPNGETTVQSDR